MLQVKIKKLSNKAVIPSYAEEGDAGMDLTATSKEIDKDGNVVYGTDIAVEIPKGYVGLLFPRSSISKKDLSLANAVGVIDSGYRGEIKFKFRMTKQFLPEIYSIDDRIGQLLIIPYPIVEFVEVDELSETKRGSGGYGSTGN